MADTYYAVHAEFDNIPDEGMWESTLDNAKETAIIDAENSRDNMIISEIAVVKRYVTRSNISLEAI